MSTWDFTTGVQPLPEADSVASKRNVVATDKGWVRQQVYTDVHNNVRVKEEVIIAAHPGGTTGGYANASFLAEPDITLIQLGSNTVTGLSSFAAASSMTVYVTWNEPLAATANVVITATEKSGSPSFTLTSNSTNDNTSKAVYAEYVGNNTLVFTGVPGVAAGNYKFEAADLLTSVTTPTSTNFDGEAASLTITGTVSNTLIDVASNVLANGEFTLV